jgi:hypothetical protein
MADAVATLVMSDDVPFSNERQQVRSEESKDPTDWSFETE